MEPITQIHPAVYWTVSLTALVLLPFLVYRAFDAITHVEKVQSAHYDLLLETQVKLAQHLQDDHGKSLLEAAGLASEPLKVTTIRDLILALGKMPPQSRLVCQFRTGAGCWQFATPHLDKAPSPASNVTVLSFVPSGEKL